MCRELGWLKFWYDRLLALPHTSLEYLSTSPQNLLPEIVRKLANELILTRTLFNWQRVTLYAISIT